ncbi:GNAT family N-acetyltransferase [Microvirga terrestris]|uniref:GNAT family N-acetyltransferase n=1 Tax=Microvirga terrestris TaxID=2791024 RepID=A0ABS0HVN9_9HYPH|nr:GNAT family N-acetyltransferase [Microvirga terrestris]MBF9197534.1 GNAT family N-acetyltransferase [Microvirga terrestris]
MTQGISVKRIDSLEALEAAGPLWNDLQNSCAHQHVMMDHRWMTSWWRHFGAGKTQHTLLVSSGRTPMGIVPLCIMRGMEVYPLRDPYIMGPDDYKFLPGLSWNRIAPLRRLTFPVNLVAGNIRGQTLFPGGGSYSYAVLADYISSISAEWDVAIFPGMRGWEQEQSLLIDAAKRVGLLPGARETTRRMLYIDLPETYDEYLQTRSAHFRRHMRQECNKVERTFSHLGKMTLDSFRGRDIEAGMQRLLSLEALSWKVMDQKERRLHLSLNDTAKSFFKEVARRFSQHDNAQIIIMRFGDTDAAGWFTLERGGTSSCILTYRNEQLGAPVGIAPVLQELVQRSISSGLKRLDINGYTRHYLKWAKDHHDYVAPMIFNTRPYSRILHFVDEGLVAVRRHILTRHSSISPGSAEASP